MEAIEDDRHGGAEGLPRILWRDWHNWHNRLRTDDVSLRPEERS